MKRVPIFGTSSIRPLKTNYSCMKRLFIIGGGEMQLPIIRKAKELGHFCIVSDFDPNAPGFLFADVQLHVSTLDYEKTLESAIDHQIDGIVTTSDYPVRTLAYVCDNMSLKGLSKLAAETCTNKFLQRQAMTMTDCYVPQYFLFSTVDEINKQLNDLVFPLIVKPIDSSASRGVSKVDNKEELFAAFEDAMQYCVEKKIIVEEFIYGNEFSVESLTQNGETHIIAITQKSTIGSEGKYFVESQHIVPADITISQEKIIHEYVRKIIETLKIDNSATHIELKLSSKGPVMIEIGARLGGDYITSDLVPLATGVDMLENVIKIALDEKINVEKTKSGFSGIKFINSDNYKNAEKFIANNKELIIRYELKPYKKILLTNSMDRLGYIIINDDSRRNLEKMLAI
jgi:biotin carboxylase